MRISITIPTVLLLLLAAYLAVLLPLLPEAAEDIRMADVFSVDEAGAAVVVRHLARRGSFELETFSYGGLFYYIPLGIVYLLDMIGVAPSDRVILVTMRAVCAAAGLGCLVMTWRIGTRVFGRPAAAFGAALLAVTPTFWRWAVEIHPDLPQLFWILCSLWSLTHLRSNPGLKYGLLAGGFAGLAAGTKYAGVFLLPVIGAGLFLPERLAEWRQDLVKRLKGGRRWIILGAAAGAFLLVAILTNPYALVHFDWFRSDVAFEKSHLGFGHMFRTTQAGLSWLTGLWGVSGNGAGIASLGGLLALAVGRNLKGRRLPVSSGLLLLWVGGYQGYLIWEVNLQAARHLLPVLPVVLLFAGYGLQRAGEFARRLPLPEWVVTALTLVLFAAVLWRPFVGGVHEYRQKYGRAEHRAEIVAGKWIGSTYPPETSILFDAYAYVPERFVRIFRTFGMSYPFVNHFQPDLIVVRDAIAGRYSDLADAERFREGEGVFLDRHYFYAYLRDGLIPEYRPTKTFPAITIYVRVAKGRPDPGEDGPRWLDLVKLYGSGRLYGLLEARIRMGNFHGGAGRWPQAASEYKQAVQMAPGHPVPHYSLGTALLHLGQRGEAGEVFGRSVALAEGKTVVHRSSVSHQIGRAYLSTGLPNAALPYLDLACELNPDARDPAFDIAACHLLLGQMMDADSAYAAAVSRFGPDPRAAVRLQEMSGVAAGSAEVDAILRRYFEVRE